MTVHTGRMAVIRSNLARWTTWVSMALGIALGIVATVAVRSFGWPLPVALGLALVLVLAAVVGLVAVDDWRKRGTR